MPACKEPPPIRLPDYYFLRQLLNRYPPPNPVDSGVLGLFVGEIVQIGKVTLLYFQSAATATGPSQPPTGRLSFEQAKRNIQEVRFQRGDLREPRDFEAKRMNEFSQRWKTFMKTVKFSSPQYKKLAYILAKGGFYISHPAPPEQTGGKMLFASIC